MQQCAFGIYEQKPKFTVSVDIRAKLTLFLLRLMSHKLSLAQQTAWLDFGIFAKVKHWRLWRITRKVYERWRFIMMSIRLQVRVPIRLGSGSYLKDTKSGKYMIIQQSLIQLPSTKTMWWSVVLTTGLYSSLTGQAAIISSKSGRPYSQDPLTQKQLYLI